MKYPNPNLETGPIDLSSRQRLMVWSMAEGAAAERLDPDDTKTVFEAIEGHDDLVLEIYNEILNSPGHELDRPVV